MPGHFSLLVKPASADCNLSCAYCFYLDRAALYPGTARHRMSLPVMEKVVSSYLSTEQPVYSFGWQGGEPSLMGVDFFRAVVRCQERHARPGAVIGNGFQTNATLVDDEWAAFLAEKNFLVGVSLDGPPGVHDLFRRDPAGRGSHERVARGLGLLRRHGAEHNALVLVTPANAVRPAETYRYILEQGFLFHQYIPCVEADPDGRALPWSVSGRQWGQFLCGLFDAWYPAGPGTVSVRLFEDIVARLVDGRAWSCSMNDDCRSYFVVEYNGDIYPCDFFVRPELKLGNLDRLGWAELAASPAYRSFGRRKSVRPAACRDCQWLSFCFGDCPKHRLAAGALDPAARSRLCEGWKRFYAHALPALEELAGDIRRRRAGEGPGPVGRNDPCPCGSGLKHKKCCLSAAGRGGE